MNRVMRKITLYVDADACPVKNEIRLIAGSFGIEPVFVASYASFSQNQESKWVYVDQRKEAADLYIVNHAFPGDLVVTQDMGLAGLLTGRGISVISIHGVEIEERRVPEILHRRYLAYKSLLAGRKIRGPRPFTDENRKEFSDALTKLLCRLVH